MAFSFTDGGTILDKERDIRISQCMIVKNEEANIGKALSWGKGIVWEQIVVDTGSTDKTVEIAASMGARVLSFPWIDDFAAAKNFAISQAKGEWIAFLDADETFAPGDEKKLVEILRQLGTTQAQAVSTGWMQLNDEGAITAAGTQIRVFRNLPGLSYRRRIHEQLEWKDKTPIRVADATKELSILHTGYCGAAWEEKKVNERNLKLILKELEDHPEDHEMMGYLGDEYYSVGDQPEAEAWYRRAVEAMPDALDSRDQRSAATFLYLMQIMSAGRRNRDEMMAVYRKAISLLPEEADFDYILGAYFAATGVYADGCEYLEQAIEKLEKYGCYNRAMMLNSHLKEAYEQLARCCLMTGEREKAVHYSVAVLKAQPYSMQALSILLEAFWGKEDRPLSPPEAVLGFLDKLYCGDQLKDRLFILKAASGVGWIELEGLMETRFTREELQCIRNIQNKERGGKLGE